MCHKAVIFSSFRHVQAHDISYGIRRLRIKTTYAIALLSVGLRNAPLMLLAMKLTIHLKLLRSIITT